ncbi:MAG: DJ-1/PfpI family protein [Lachnospiraceae bacterium]|nr:DJ-1/PfpI family protein [Lachnospiraceae bacterium]
MGKILCYIYEDMADYEVSLVLHYLRNIGKYEVVAISEEKKLLNAQTGLQFVPDMSIAEWKQTEVPEEYDALIIPGGPINHQQNQICDVIRAMANAGKLVAAICFGPQFLARAGVLEEYAYTTSCSADMIQEWGYVDSFPRGNYQENRCVVDRNVITAQGHAFVDFAEAVCDYLEIFESPKQRQELFGRIVEIQQWK